MSVWRTAWVVVLGCSMLVGCQTQEAADVSPTISVVTSDGVQIYGERYFGDLGGEAPLILLFHQGGSNGRGEYAGIANWLNGEGYRALAWDQRRGGESFGSENRTLAGLEEGAEYGYCDAAPDLQAAIDYVRAEGLAERVVLWGSSYSAALVFQMAADNSDAVSGVIAFSPASGGPLADCLARQWLDEIEAPMFAFRPKSEMASSSAQEQKQIFEAAGVKVFVAENGVHGSSMLVDDRTGQDMSAIRREVADWLGALE